MKTMKKICVNCVFYKPDFNLIGMKNTQKLFGWANFTNSSVKYQARMQLPLEKFYLFLFSWYL